MLSISLHNSSTSIVGMGVSLIAKHDIGNLSKRLKQGFISHSFHCRRHSNCCTLVTRQSASILKVGVAPVY